MPAKRRLTAEDLYALRLVEDPQISPDGRRIAFVRASIDKVANQYRRHIWLATLDDGRAVQVRQFTYGPKADTTPRWSPDGRTLAFVSVRGERPQIYLIGLDGGEARPLTNRRQGAGEPVWSPDGRRIAFVGRANAEERQREDEGREEPPPETALEARHRQEREAEQEKEKADPRVVTRLPYRTGTEFMDDRRGHLYVVDVPAPDGDGPLPKPRRLTDGDLDFGTPQWTGDGRALITTQSREPEYEAWFQHDLVRVPAAGQRKAFRRLTRPDYEYAQPRVSPDGRWIAALRRPLDGGMGRRYRLVVMPASGGQPREVAPGLDRTVSQVTWSADSRCLYFLVADEGATGVRCVEIEPALNNGAAPAARVIGGNRMISGFSLDRNGQVAFAASTPLRPTDLYLAPPGGKRERRLTDFNRKLLSEVELSPPEEIRYTAPDGRPLQGWLHKPVGFRQGQRYPLVVHVHGGPHVMWGPAYPSMWIEWQLHTARGYAVFYCNPRGADGYGEAFAEAIHGDWGDHVMHDILAGVDVVTARGFVDTRRMALTGGSYAGYMTAWIISHDHRFACAWAQRGLYNLLSFHGTTDIPQLIEREMDMLPFDNVEKAWQQSPLAYVRGIRTPLAIEHQDQDYRCPVSEAEQLFAALKRLRREVIFVRYPREGHEMSRSGEPRHRVDRLNRMTAWFDKYCKKK